MSNILVLTIFFLTSVILSTIVIRNVLHVAYSLNLFDLPGERKMHTATIPRLGGFAFLPVLIILSLFYVGICLSEGTEPISDQHVFQHLFFISGGILLSLVGLKDDLIGENYRFKFYVQLFAAILLIASGAMLTYWGGILGISFVPTIVAALFTIFLVVFITNAVNLIDGIDGLASGLCMFSLLVFVIINWICGDLFHAVVAIIAIGSLVPFWYFNVYGKVDHETKLFMGDTGSLVLGFILSYLLICSCQSAEMPTIENRFPYLFIGLSSLFVPMLDVVRVFFIRFMNGKNPFLSDKNHFHHKMIRFGLKPYNSMMFIVFTSSFFIGLNTVLVLLGININIILLIDFVTWFLMHFVLSSIIKTKETSDK